MNKLKRIRWSIRSFRIKRKLKAHDKVLKKCSKQLMSMVEEIQDDELRSDINSLLWLSSRVKSKSDFEELLTQLNDSIRTKG